VVAVLVIASVHAADTPAERDLDQQQRASGRVPLGPGRRVSRACDDDRARARRGRRWRHAGHQRLAIGKPLAYAGSVKVAWDAAKNLANQRKHGLAFEEAQELFLSGRDYLEIFDDAHSDLEDRFIAIGPIARGLVLVVWTERDEDTIRIISARWATKRERSLYVNYLKENR
jgi:uncharacterized DUF497 family protein